MRAMMTGLALALLLAATPMHAQVPVQVQPLREVLVDLERRAPADVRALNDALLAAEVAAVVDSVQADVGQRVAAGELLLVLDEADYQLALQQAEASLAAARAQHAEADTKLRRATDLARDQYLSADELLERETRAQVAATTIRSAEVALAVARRNLERCRIRAPFNGVVAARLAQVGAYVAPGMPVLQLTQLDGFELDAEIPAAEAASLETASAIRFESQLRAWPVRLLRLSPVIEMERRSRRARFAFTEGAPEIGRSGEVIWRVAGGQLPASLVSRRDGQLGVFLAEAGKAVFRPLPAAQEGRPVPVDLPGDTEVVVLGRERLQHGDLLDVQR